MSPLTGVLREAWELYKEHAAHFLTISFSIYIVAALVASVLTAFGGTLGAIVAAIVNLFAIFLLQAALVEAVRDIRDGRADLDLRATTSAALPRVLPVAGASILASIGITIGFIFIVVPGFVLLTFWSLIVPAIVVGDARLTESFGRSWNIVRGYGWPVFGTYVLVFIIWVVFDIVLGLVLVLLPLFFRSFVTEVVAGGLIAPFLALVLTLIYYRLTGAHAAGGPRSPYGANPPPPYGTGPRPPYGNNPPPPYGTDPPPPYGNNPPPPYGTDPPPSYETGPRPPYGTDG